MNDPQLRVPADAGRLVGVVLTGGASRRMGRTKALVTIDGVPMAARVAAVLRSVGCATTVLFGGDAAELAELEVPVVADRYPGTGPTGGVLGALEMLRDDPGTAGGAALIVACDLAYLTAAALAPLIAAAGRTDDDADVFVARTTALEPACAIWRVAAAPRVRAIFHDGERALHRVVDRLAHTEVAIDPVALRNINTPGDIDRYPDAVTVAEISVHDLEALGPNARIIDVREPDEWAQGHIGHAALVPLGTVPDNIASFDGDPTYLVCRSGARSGRACELLAGHGCNVVNVTGGMLAWVDAGFAIVTGTAPGAPGA